MKTVVSTPLRDLPAESVFGRAPLAFAVTEGPRHTILYANPAFRRAQSTGEIMFGMEQAPGSARKAGLRAVLDAVYRSGRAVNDLTLDCPTDPVPAWSCAVWLIAPAADDPRRLVIELHDVSLGEDERAWQRALAERLVLSALREQDAAREIGRAHV